MFNNIEELREIIAQIELQINKAKAIFNEFGFEAPNYSSDFLSKAKSLGSETMQGNTKIIEGVFDGTQMIGPDGKRYSIPANYCSKSKLVEGDILKLTIKSDGSFVYKQIAPIERKRIKGILSKDIITGEFTIMAEGRQYKVIKASVTYFRGEDGDEVIALVPKDGESVYCAVENIINVTNNNMDLKVDDTIGYEI
ncbi:MAG TPA: hypothetical protein PLD95_03295 [bacterium]|jgi:hypothetical protein|nr:hypothetical protein [bacterium]HOG38471.1 hypothetical protein [bacterium]